MPAVSKAQKRFFGAMKGHPEEAKRRGISEEAIDEFAKGKGEDLPEHVAKKAAAERFGKKKHGR